MMNNAWTFALAFIAIIIGVLLMTMKGDDISAIKNLFVKIHFQIGCLIALIGAVALFLLSFMNVSML